VPESIVPLLHLAHIAKTLQVSQAFTSDMVITQVPHISRAVLTLLAAVAVKRKPDQALSAPSLGSLITR